MWPKKYLSLPCDKIGAISLNNSESGGFWGMACQLSAASCILPERGAPLSGTAARPSLRHGPEASVRGGQDRLDNFSQPLF